MAFVSQVEPSKITDAIDDDQQILAMQEKVYQFERNQVWDLFPRPKVVPDGR